MLTEEQISRALDELVARSPKVDGRIAIPNDHRQSYMKQDVVTYYFILGWLFGTKPDGFICSEIYPMIPSDDDVDDWMDYNFKSAADLRSAVRAERERMLAQNGTTLIRPRFLLAETTMYGWAFGLFPETFSMSDICLPKESELVHYQAVNGHEFSVLRRTIKRNHNPIPKQKKEK